MTTLRKPEDIMPLKKALALYNKYGKKWFCNKFGYNPTKVNGSTTIMNELEREKKFAPTTYGVALTEIYRLIDKYEKLNAPEVVEDLRASIQPIKYVP